MSAIFPKRKRGGGWDGRVALSTGVVYILLCLGREGREEKEKEGIE